MKSTSVISIRSLVHGASPISIAVLSVFFNNRIDLITLFIYFIRQTVKPFNPEVVDKVLGEDKKNAITCRPADLLEPELDKIEAEMKQYKQQDEDVLSYALFPQVATDFFKYREAQQTGVDAKTADTKNGAYPV